MGVTFFWWGVTFKYTSNCPKEWNTYVAIKTYAIREYLMLWNNAYDK